MYSIINENIDKIIKFLNPESINEYVWIRERFNQINVAKDVEFQRRYRVYSRMYGARLSEDYCSRYFGYLEYYKKKRKVDIKRLSKLLYKIPTHLNGKKSLQFSFTTKLVHMVDTHRPIYDQMVRDFFYLPEPKQNWTFNEKLENYLSSYSFLIHEYKRVLKSGLLSRAIKEFRKNYKISSYTDEKIIDTLIWCFVGTAKNGEVRSGKFKYY